MSLFGRELCHCHAHGNNQNRTLLPFFPGTLICPASLYIIFYIWLNQSMDKRTLKFKELVLKTRSYRRFRQDVKITPENMEYLIDLARNTPSARNAQPLKYIYSCDPLKNNEIFSCLKWAGALPDWDGPSEGEKPGGFIVMLLDTEISANPFWDPGIALQTIMLGASEMGLAGCPIANIESGRLANLLGLPKQGNAGWRHQVAGGAVEQDDGLGVRKLRIGVGEEIRVRAKAEFIGWGE